MAFSSIEDIMEWVGVFRSIEENGGGNVCIFIDNNAEDVPFNHGVPDEFRTAETAAKSRVAYLDGTFCESACETAFHIGYGDELELAELFMLSAEYSPKIVGLTADDYMVIIAEKRGTTMPAKSHYSPNQIASIHLWFLVLLPILPGQLVVIMKNSEKNTLFVDDEHILSVKFINEAADEIEEDILANTLFAGEINDLTWNVIDELTQVHLKGIACSPDGVLALLY